ncbi:MAG: MerR family transcriptional regulator [Oscillospiraceae bacterium]|nr:MerR family transcriptional regulator [Oscillospiraceae bacterium]
MTILEIARLCGTSTQTLRYYDRIGLLTPSRVDGWTGYRYYEKEQAAVFVKIKDLQLADFSIAEIKTLLSAPDEAVRKAFDGKIAAEQEKLAKILKIRESYRKNAMDIDEKIRAIAAFLNGELPGEALKQRYPDLEPTEIAQWKDKVEGFRPEDYEPIGERRGFRSFPAALKELPPLGNGAYALVAGTAEATDKNALIEQLMNAALDRFPSSGGERKITVVLVDAPEGENILELMRKRT